MKKAYIIIISIFLLYCSTDIDSKKKEGNRIKQKIKEHKSLYGFYPSSLLSVDSTYSESSIIHYLLLDSNKFILWYGKTLGESCIYVSDIDSWVNSVSNVVIDKKRSNVSD